MVFNKLITISSMTLIHVTFYIVWPIKLQKNLAEAVRMMFLYCLNNLIIYTIISHHEWHVNMYIGVYKELLYYK